MPDLITLTPHNLPSEHICCALSSSKNAAGVEAKKQWLAARMEEGLKFRKINVRGKAFIEYLPAENAWVPVDAPGYMMVNCHWVAGAHKGHGYGRQLLEACESDARTAHGVVVISAPRKKPFLSDKSFFIAAGYEVCDECPPYFELLVKRFDSRAPLPRFRPSARVGLPAGATGIDIFYTEQCPFTIPYVGLIGPVVDASDFPVRIHRIGDRETARNHACPITTYSVFANGKYLTNEILTPSKLEKLIDRLQQEQSL